MNDSIYFNHHYIADRIEVCVIVARINTTAARPDLRHLLYLNLITVFMPFIVFICAADSATHLRRAVIKTHLVAHLFTKNVAHLIGYPLGHRNSSQSARHGDADFPMLTKTWTRDVVLG